MRKAFLAALVLVVAVAPGFSRNAEKSSVRPQDGFVPNEQTAVKIGEAVLIPVYGEKQIDSERPFTAKFTREHLDRYGNPELRRAVM
jgi:hypothetical protein